MLSQAEEERPELAADASNAAGVDANGDESGRVSGRVDEETDGGVSRGHEVVAEISERAPPTPEKDGDAVRVSGQMAVADLAPEGTSGSAT